MSLTGDFFLLMSTQKIIVLGSGYLFFIVICPGISVKVANHPSSVSLFVESSGLYVHWEQ